MTPEDLQKIERLEKHNENVSQSIKYSVDRFDILVISLSSGGIALCTTFAKDILEVFPCINIILLKLASVLFGFTIVLNLFSQVTAYYACKREFQAVKNLIRDIKGKPKQGNQSKLEKSKVGFNSTTHILNAICLFSLTTAIVLVAVFMFIKL